LVRKERVGDGKHFGNETEPERTNEIHGMLNCRQVTRLVSQSMDAPLSWHQRLAVRFHMLYCVWCRRYVLQLRFLRNAAQRLGQQESNAVMQKLSEDAKEQMRTRVGQALKNAPPPQS
jgi:hypothetical protein